MAKIHTCINIKHNDEVKLKMTRAQMTLYKIAVPIQIKHNIMQLYWNTRV